MAHFRQRNGRWTVEIRIKGCKPVTKTFRTKAAGATWARKAEDDLRAGVYGATAVTTLLSALLRDYETQFTPRKRAQVQERSRLRVLGAHLGHHSVANLAPQCIVDYVDERLVDVVSDTVRRELSTLAVVLDTARSLWGVQFAENPVRVARETLKAHGALLPGKKRERRLRPGEWRQLLRALPTAALGPVKVAVRTGMRRGELVAIRKEHLRGSLLDIPKTKTGKARTIPVSRKVRKLLEGPLWGMKADSLTQAFERACEKAGIEDLRLHDLRHEATSRLFEKGLEIQEVALITGHEDWSSLKRYTQLRPETVGKKL